MLTILGYLNIFAIIGVVGAVFYFGILSARILRQIINKNINTDVIADSMVSRMLMLGSLMIGVVIFGIILFIPVQFVSPVLHIILVILTVNVLLFAGSFIYALHQEYKDLYN